LRIAETWVRIPVRQSLFLSGFTTANLFEDFSSASEALLPTSPDQAQARIQFIQESLFPGIAELARAAQDAKKESFDKTHKLVDIPIDSYVMVRDNARRKKLDPRFEGPFKVISKSRNKFTLQDNSGALLPHDYPPSALKLISEDPVFDSKSFQVDAILDHRVPDHGHGYEYLVHWKNYSGEHDLWLPADNFDDEATISDYWNRRNKSAVGTSTAGRG
jgi:hypothetical protein